MATALSFKRKPADAAPAPTNPAPINPAPTNAAPTNPAPAAAVPAAQVEKVLAAAQEPAPAAHASPPPAAPATTGTPAGNQNPVTDLAVQASGEVVPEDYYNGVGGFEGEWSSKDMATPYLSIVGKTSKAFDTHPDWMGQFLYDREYPLGTEIRAVFIRATKWFVEDLPFGVQQIPQRFARMADARAAGFNESTLKDQADLDLLIEVDASLEGVGDLAHIIEGGKGYILARYTVQSTAFGKTAAILAKDMGGFLRGNLINGFYLMSTQQKTSPKGTYYIPILKTDGKTTEGLKRQIADRLSLAIAAA